VDDEIARAHKEILFSDVSRRGQLSVPVKLTDRQVCMRVLQ
jgi:hypothetical protein